MNNKDFEVMVNALSVGWHLRKIMEASPDPMSREEWDKFVYWCERHNIKGS